MKKYTAVLTKPQAPKFVVDMEWMVEPVLTEKRRDSDGRFLKVHVPLNTAERTHSAANVEMANRYGVDADELFAA